MNEHNWQDESEQDPNMSREQRLAMRKYKIKVRAAANELDSALTEVIKEEISSEQQKLDFWKNSKKSNTIWSYVLDGIIAVNLGVVMAETYASSVTLRESLDTRQNLYLAVITILPVLCRIYCEIKNKYVLPAGINSAKKNLDELTQIYAKNCAQKDFNF